MNRSNRLVVCDAGPLIHLSELACLDLLLDFDHVLIPEIVTQEVEKHCPGALLPFNHRFAQIPDAETAAPRVLEQIQRSYELHAGELAALALTLQNPGALLLTDDSAARVAAQTLQLTVHGTIGVILRSLRRQQRTKVQVLALLRELPVRSTLHIAPSLLASIVVEVEG